MADAVTSRTLVDDDRNFAIALGSVSDGTGESAVTKVVLANVAQVYDPVTRTKKAPVALDLAAISFNMGTFTSVDLFWKATANQRIIRILATGYGYINYTGRGILIGDTITSACLQSDTTQAGYTGDILLTSSATLNGVYNIVAWFRKRVA